ncbi:hypothetical protein HYW17_04135 [Candidatus Uhrbacteria bacterium]|nr:hypothetical protein [Candidatus Uhrbacteria bacterium]
MKYREFTKIIEKPYFTRTELRIRNLQVPDYQLSRWQGMGDIEKIQRGIFVFTARKKEVIPEEVAFLLYEPSYISLEYALHHYGFIPEMVAVCTSVTTRPTRTIANQFGRFSYRTIVPKLFWGYGDIETKHGKYLFAHPEKALLDYFYLNPRAIRTRDDLEGMRFDYETMSTTLNRARIKKYVKQFHSKRLDQLVNELLALCSPSRS